MSRHLRDMADLPDLDRAIVLSETTPVLIFKHSTTCGTSAMAYEEIVDALEAIHLHAHAFLVQVHAHRKVSNAIAARLGVRHESPQVLLVHHGRVVWSASHFRVTATNVIKKLREASDAPVETTA